ncbi:MAG TPA: DUF6789 family protein [Thermomicrobiales bacterium]|nr:DUF6789 family protein [Thermomicrobiales bacterium]
MNTLERGAAAGAIATAAMTLVIAGGRAAGLLFVPPPAEIARAAAAKAGVEAEPPGWIDRAVWMSEHAGYGVACGVGYALARPRLPASPAVAGLLWGGAIWAVSYLGLMPALGLYPWPDDDRPTRTSVMLAAHAVYGLTLAECERRLAG